MTTINCFLLFFIFIFFGCTNPQTVNIKPDIDKVLQPATLRSSFNTNPPNLKSLTNCTNTQINIINENKTNENIVLAPGKVHPGWHVNTSEIAAQLTEYLKDAVRQCRLTQDQTSKKIIAISLQKIDGYAGFGSSATLYVNVRIPEKNITIPLVITQNTFELPNAVAYSIHAMTWQIINDPVIQDHMLCK
ncbi:MAG: hypothetical protein A4E71_01552 [Smithella sp. PtaU1.Bin162]|nr:MAG: hypothetical protein A4E71_01552 [Smithella sp. PtaU1.Bin162]